MVLRKRTPSSCSQTARKSGGRLSMRVCSAALRALMSASFPSAIRLSSSRARPSPKTRLRSLVRSRMDVFAEFFICWEKASQAFGFVAFRQPASPSASPERMSDWNPSPLADARRIREFTGAGCLSRSSARRRAMSRRVSGSSQTLASLGSSPGNESATGMSPYQMSAGKLWSAASSRWATSAAARGIRSSMDRR